MKYDSLWLKYNEKKRSHIIYRSIANEDDAIKCSLVIREFLSAFANQHKIEESKLIDIFSNMLNLPNSGDKDISKLTWAFANFFLLKDLLSSEQDAFKKFVNSEPSRKNLFEAETFITQNNIEFQVNSSEDLFLQHNIEENTCRFI